MPQHNAFILFLVFSVLTVWAFVFVARSTRRPAEVPYSAVARARRWVLVALAAVLAGFLWLTLPRLPYPDAGVVPDRVVHVRARQFFFEFSDRPFEVAAAAPADEDALPAAAPPAVKVGELIEYRVSSGDATHGFGIYDSRGRLVTQTQAMPGYVNRLRHRFSMPGTYPVLCLEYCGLGHHAMRAQILVTDR